MGVVGNTGPTELGWSPACRVERPKRLLRILTGGGWAPAGGVLHVTAER